MRREGRVVASEQGRVSVCFQRPEACQSCGACAGHQHETLAWIPGDAPVGSRVEVEMPDQQVVKASLLAYALPLLLLLAGLFAGMRLFQSEIAGAALGIGLMALSYGLLRLAEKRMGKKRQWQPRIVAVQKEGETNYGTEADER